MQSSNNNTLSQSSGMVPGDCTFSLSQLPLKPQNPSGSNDTLLIANYFQIDPANQLKDVKLHRYVVKIFKKNGDELSKQEVKPKRLRRRLLFLFINTCHKNRKAVATDYDTIVISGKRTPKDEFTSDISHYEADDERQVETDKYQLTFNFDKSLVVDNLFKDLNSRECDIQKLETIQALNIIVVSTPNQNVDVMQVRSTRYFRVGGNLTKPRRDLRGGLCALQGFSSSVRPASGRLLLNLNVLTSSFYNPGNLIDLAESFGYKPPAKVNRDTLWFFRRLRVKMDYLRNWNPQKRRKVRVITDIARNASGSGKDSTQLVINMTNNSGRPQELTVQD
jgi:eukaryotic translation initiation factor 2C